MSSDSYVRPSLAGLAALLFALAISAPGSASEVSGSFVYRDGAPAKDRQLHFENQVSHDWFIAVTNGDGNFRVDLPPGTYDLRAERGVVLKPDIVVSQGPLDVGRSIEPAPLDVRRPFEHEGLGQSYVTTVAPATANVHGRPIESLSFGHEVVQSLWGTPTAMAPLPPEGSGPDPYAVPSRVTSPGAGQ